MLRQKFHESLTNVLFYLVVEWEASEWVRLRREEGGNGHTRDNESRFLATLYSIQRNAVCINGENYVI